MPYKIPKNRTTVKTIKMKNGTLTGEADDQGNMYWFKDGKYITPNQLKSYKYYDPSVKGYRTLGDKATYISNKGIIEFTGVKTPLYRPAYEELVKRGTEKQMADYKREEEQNIPLQNQKWITLRTKGNMNLVDVPLNMLDSIAVNAGRSNTDFWTDASLIGKESTFAGFSKALNSPYSSTITGVSPHELTNNHAWYDNPEQDYISAINRNYKSFNEEEQIEAEKNMKYALEHGLVKATTPRYSDYILADAFKRYQVSPAQYNPGQKNYVPMLNGIRQELQGEKQLQQYWNTRGKQEYARGQKEGMAYGGFLQPKDAWDALSMEAKAEMMKVAISHGIYNLDDIRKKYNEFAEGGSTDADLVDWIIKEEGFNTKPEDIGDGKMTLGSGLTSSKWHELYKKRGNKWSTADNKMAVAEEVANRRRWAEKNIPNWDTLPESSQKALLSYKYNYDFNRANSPKLFKALEAGNLQEAARQIDATSKDPKFKKGLQERRQREQNWFLSDINSAPTIPVIPFEQPVSTAVFNPYIQQAENTRIAPVIVPDEDSYVTAHKLTEAEERKQRFQERMEAINNFNRLMQMASVENTAVHTFMPTTGNTFLDSMMGLTKAEGGKIYIKPSHRGRLTELKKRTGKSEAELYKTGSAATRKMITFARNARKWKHGLGGDLNTYNYENTFGGGGLFGNETVDTVASFLPILGTAEDAYQFYQNPSWVNAGWLALSLGSDILTGGMAARGIKALRAANKAVDAANAASKTAAKEWRAAKAANGANHTRESGTRVRHAINAAGSAGAIRDTAIKRSNNALFEAGISTGIDQGFNGFINAIQNDMLPTFGLQQKHGEGGNLFMHNEAKEMQDK